MVHSIAKGEQASNDGEGVRRITDRTLRSSTSKEQRSYYPRHHNELKEYQRRHNFIKGVGRRKMSEVEGAQREMEFGAIFDWQNEKVAASSLEETDGSEDTRPDATQHPRIISPDDKPPGPASLIESSSRNRKRNERRKTAGTPMPSAEPGAMPPRRSTRRANSDHSRISRDKSAPFESHPGRPARRSAVPKVKSSGSSRIRSYVEDEFDRQETHGRDRESTHANSGPSQSPMVLTPNPSHTIPYSHTAPTPTSPPHHLRRGQIVWSQTFVNVTANDLHRKGVAVADGDVQFDTSSSRSMHRVVWPEDRRHNSSPPPPTQCPPPPDVTSHNVFNPSPSLIGSQSSFTWVPYVPTPVGKRNPIDDNAAAETLLALSGNISVRGDQDTRQSKSP